MSHPYYHALSSVKKHGGKPEDYQKIHDWFDSSKAAFADWRHRALLHNAFGIFLAEQLFGTTITNSDGKEVPTRIIAEQHVREDLGWIPTVKDWLQNITTKEDGSTAWMTKGVVPRPDLAQPSIED